MVVFNECRVDDEAKRLLIEASVDTLNYYNQVYINAVIVDTDETYSESGPSSTPVYSKEYEAIDETMTDYAPPTDEEDDTVEAVEVTISSVGYATLYYGDYNLKIPEGITAYVVVVTSEDASSVDITPISTNVIPAGTAVIIMGDAGTYTFKVISGTYTLSGYNDLLGTDSDDLIGNDGATYYILGKVNGMEFYYQTGTGGAYVQNIAHKGYLRIPSDFTPSSKTNTVVRSTRVLDTSPCGQVIPITIETEEKGVLRKHIQLALTANDLSLTSLQDNMFFVYIEVAGLPDISTPCTMDNQYTLGVAFDWRSIYNQGLKFLKELYRACSLPKGFIDFILRFKALQLALRTGHYVEAINFWKKYFKKNITESINSGCGCGT